MIPDLLGDLLDALRGKPEKTIEKAVREFNRRRLANGRNLIPVAGVLAYFRKKKTEKPAPSPKLVSEPEKEIEPMNLAPLQNPTEFVRDLALRPNLTSEETGSAIGTYNLQRIARGLNPVPIRTLSDAVTARRASVATPIPPKKAPAKTASGRPPRPGWEPAEVEILSRTRWGRRRDILAAIVAELRALGSTRSRGAILRKYERMCSETPAVDPTPEVGAISPDRAAIRVRIAELIPRMLPEHRKSVDEIEVRLTNFGLKALEEALEVSRVEFLLGEKR